MGYRLSVTKKEIDKLCELVGREDAKFNIREGRMDKLVHKLFVKLHNKKVDINNKNNGGV